MKMLRMTMVLAALSLAPSARAGAQLYFTGNDSNYTTGNIWRTEAGTNVVETIYTVGYNNGRPMMVKEFEDWIYWTTYYPGQLWRSGLNGENPQLLVNQGQDTTTRAIQFRDEKVYWTNEALGALYRADLDGNNVETVISGYNGGNGGLWDFELHGDRIYWTSWDSPSVRTVKLDGSDYQVIPIPTVGRVFCIEIEGDTMYLTDRVSFDDSDRVVAVDLDGGNLVELVSGVNTIHGLDVSLGRIYYTSEIPGPLESRIYSIPLNGGLPQEEMVAPGLQIWQLEVVEVPCFVVLVEEVVCHADGVTFTYTADGFVGCTGTIMSVSFTGSGGVPGQLFCSTALIGDGAGLCCSTTICFPVPDCSTEPLPSDLDGDGSVGILDLLALLAAWGTTPDGPPDLDGDGSVGIVDLLILLSDWG